MILVQEIGEEKIGRDIKDKTIVFIRGSMSYSTFFYRFNNLSSLFPILLIVAHAGSID